MLTYILDLHVIIQSSLSTRQGHTTVTIISETGEDCRLSFITMTREGIYHALSDYFPFSWYLGTCLCFSEDGRWLVTTSRKSKVAQVWDTRTAQTIGCQIQISSHAEGYNAACVYNKETEAIEVFVLWATHEQDHFMSLFDALSGELLASRPVHGLTTFDERYLDDGNLISSATTNVVSYLGERMILIVDIHPFGDVARLAVDDMNKEGTISSSNLVIKMFYPHSAALVSEDVLEFAYLNGRKRWPCVVGVPIPICARQNVSVPICAPGFVGYKPSGYPTSCSVYWQ